MSDPGGSRPTLEQQYSSGKLVAPAGDAPAGSYSAALKKTGVPVHPREAAGWFRRALACWGLVAIALGVFIVPLIGSVFYWATYIFWVSVLLVLPSGYVFFRVAYTDGLLTTNSERDAALLSAVAALFGVSVCISVCLLWSPREYNEALALKVDDEYNHFVYYKHGVAEMSVLTGEEYGDWTDAEWDEHWETVTHFVGTTAVVHANRRTEVTDALTAQCYWPVTKEADQGSPVVGWYSCQAEGQDGSPMPNCCGSESGEDYTLSRCCQRAGRVDEDPRPIRYSFTVQTQYLGKVPALAVTSYNDSQSLEERASHVVIDTAYEGVFTVETDAADVVRTLGALFYLGVGCGAAAVVVRKAKAAKTLIQAWEAAQPATPPADESEPPSDKAQEPLTGAPPAYNSFVAAAYSAPTPVTGSNALTPTVQPMSLQTIWTAVMIVVFIGTLIGMDVVYSETYFVENHLLEPTVIFGLFAASVCALLAVCHFQREPVMGKAAFTGALASGSLFAGLAATLACVALIFSFEDAWYYNDSLDATYSYIDADSLYDYHYASDAAPWWQWIHYDMIQNIEIGLEYATDITYDNGGPEFDEYGCIIPILYPGWTVGDPASGVVLAVSYSGVPANCTDPEFATFYATMSRNTSVYTNTTDWPFEWWAEYDDGSGLHAQALDHLLDVHPALLAGSDRSTWHQRTLLYQLRPELIGCADCEVVPRDGIGLPEFIVEITGILILWGCVAPCCLVCLSSSRFSKRWGELSRAGMTSFIPSYTGNPYTSGSPHPAAPAPVFYFPGSSSGQVAVAHPVPYPASDNPYAPSAPKA